MSTERTGAGKVCVFGNLARAARAVRATVVYGLTAGLVLTMLPAALAGDAGSSTGLSQEEIDRALLATYIHGINDELAHRVLGPEAVPRILEHLADPDYPRRDNLVAFLIYLGGPESRQALLATFIHSGLAVSVPEEDRARLMVPHALGKLASRGDDESLELLLAMTNGKRHTLIDQAAAGYPDLVRARADLIENALLGLAYSETARARNRLMDVGLARLDATPGGRDLSGSALDFLDLMDELATSPHGAATTTSGQGGSAGGGPVDPGDSGPFQGVVRDADLGDGHSDVETRNFDTQNFVHENRLTYANHIDISSKMDNDRLDAVLLNASQKLAQENYAEDVACCATAVRQGNALTYGIPGDGRDSIDSNSESGQVIGNSIARVKVIRAINYCGGPGSNIIGCAYVGGWGMALVRMSNLTYEALLWIHEYGHNTGLSHPNDSQRIMYHTNLGSNNGLIQGECNRYHSPSSGAQALVSNIGTCEDSDGDSVHDLLDNCPDDTNSSQSDLDGDGVGSSCDNCYNVYNPDQANHDNDPNGDACDTDDDNDGVPDEEDCQPINPFGGAYAQEASGLGWMEPGSYTLTWTDGAHGWSANVYRGSLSPGLAPGWGCLVDFVLNDSYEDAEDPQLNEVFGYLVTSENACGESGAGTDSDGGDRDASSCQ